MGNTKEEMRFGTPTRSSTAFMVTGRVAPEELVEKAMAIGSVMLRRKVHGLRRDSRIISSGRVTKKWITRPEAMVTM